MIPKRRLRTGENGDFVLNATISPPTHQDIASSSKVSSTFDDSLASCCISNSRNSKDKVNKIGKIIFETICAATGIVLYVYLIGYLMIYKQQSFNYVFLLGISVWVIAMLASIFQDEVLYYTKKFVGPQSPKSSPLSHMTASSRPCTIEYNIQVQLVTGLVTYLIAGAILLFYDNYNFNKESDPTFISISTKTITAFVAGRNSTTQSNIHLNGRFHAAAVPIAATVRRYLTQLFHLASIDKSYQNNESLLQVVSILSSYHMFEQAWWSIFCYPLDVVNKYPTGIRLLESNTILPVLLICSVLLKNQYEIIQSLNTNSSTYHESIRTSLYGWIIIKVIDFAYSWMNNNQKLTSYTYPFIIDGTQLAQERIGADDHFLSPSMQVGSDRDHNNVWNIYGNQYDVTEFVKHHPGGSESIMLAANRPDATALFQSYHPFNIRKARAVLAKYQIHRTTSSGSINVNSDKQDSTDSLDHQSLVKYGHDNDIFYDILCQRVAGALQKHHIDPIKDRDATWNRVALYATIIAINMFLLYKHCQGHILWSIVFAYFGDKCSAHIGHDGGHFSISRKYPILNDIGVWGFFLISNPIIWQHQHTFAHHSYTNDHHKDPDLHHFKGLFKTRSDEDEGDFYFDIVNLTKVRGGKGYYWYIMLVFSQVALALSWWFPFMFVFDRSLHGVTDWSDRRQWHRTGQLLLHWVLYTLVVFCVPFMVQKNSLLALVQILAHTITISLVFALVTQVGHVADDTLNTNVIDEQRIKRHSVAQQSWAAEQVVTTQNFNPQSDVVFFFGNGLNVQIEHHLFPYLNHCHLQKIQPIVEQTCKEYNVSYKKYSSWTEAWQVATEYLTSLGKH